VKKGWFLFILQQMKLAFPQGQENGEVNPQKSKGSKGNKKPNETHTWFIQNISKQSRRNSKKSRGGTYENSPKC
jgi:hypothetical protein